MWSFKWPLKHSEYKWLTDNTRLMNGIPSHHIEAAVWYSVTETTTITHIPFVRYNKFRNIHWSKFRSIFFKIKRRGEWARYIHQYVATAHSNNNYVAALRTHLRGRTSCAAPRGPPAQLTRRRDVWVRFIESIYKAIPHIGDLKEITRRVVPAICVSPVVFNYLFARCQECLKVVRGNAKHLILHAVTFIQFYTTEYRVRYPKILKGVSLQTPDFSDMVVVRKA